MASTVKTGKYRPGDEQNADEKFRAFDSVVEAIDHVLANAE